MNIPALRELLEDLLPTRAKVENVRVEHNFEQLGDRVMLLNARRIEQPGSPDRILLAIEDITERERSRFVLEAQKEFAEKVFDAARDALLVLGWDLRVRSANQTFYTKFRVESGKTVGHLIYEIGNGEWDIPAFTRTPGEGAARE